MAFQLRRRPPGRGTAVVLAVSHPALLDLDAALGDAKPRPVIEHVSVPGSLELAPVFDEVVARTAAVTEPADEPAPVVVLWTPQDRLVEVTYVHQLELGTAPTFDQHFERALARDLSYAPLIQGLAGLDGVGTVTSLSWSVAERNLAACVAAILEPLGSRMRARTLARMARPAAPAGFLSVRGAQVLHALQPFIDTADERALVNAFVREQFPAVDMERTTYLDETTRTELLQRYFSDAAALASSATGVVQ